MVQHGHYVLGGDNPPKSTYYEQGKFGRMFPTLPPFASDTPTVRAALKELGKKGGIMDAKDDMDIAANPNLARDLITNPALSINNPDNADSAGKPVLTAGMTFLGQFLDHDMTFDPTSSLERQSVRNPFRTSGIPCLSSIACMDLVPMHRHISMIRVQTAKVSNFWWRQSPIHRRFPSGDLRALICLETARTLHLLVIHVTMKI